MARRFSRINRGDEYKKALTNKQKYDADASKRPTKRLQGGNRTKSNNRDRKEVFVKPFAVATNANFKGYVLLASDPETPASAKFKENIVAKNRLAVTVTDEDAPKWFSISDEYKPAKVTIFVPETGDPKYVQSKPTKLYYLKYPGKNYSCVFGAKDDTEEFAAGSRALKNDFKNDFKTSKYFRISIKNEILVV